MNGPVARAEILEGALRTILRGDELARLMWRHAHRAGYSTPDPDAVQIGLLAQAALDRAGGSVTVRYQGADAPTHVHAGQARLAALVARLGRHVARAGR